MVYGLVQCRNDIGLDTCSECVTAASQMVTKCNLTGEGIVWYYECMLRYANRNIFFLSETSPNITEYSFQNVSNYDGFSPILANSMDELIKKASSDAHHFSSSETNLTLFQQLYSFAQCTPDITDFGCDSCLKSALSRINSCCSNSSKVAAFFPNCQLRYDSSPFLIDRASPPAPPPWAIKQASPPGKKESSLKPAIIGAICGCVSVGLMVISIVLWFCYCRKRPKETSGDATRASKRCLPNGTVKSDEENLGATGFVQYKFVTLKTATRNFSDENKLGEGGFGPVYKATLEDGEELAIKRLSETPGGQGTKEFLAEASLLAKLQHRNLVKLIGFCSEEGEKLLAYEFMSNSSLDGYLFDSKKRLLLDWVIRYKIIIGIAKGLQYLHEDSRLMIIHRDLKPANILLDKDLNPKIADFGTAKHFRRAQKFANTDLIVGTRGYMAPEYLMTGKYSEKSDVYSFGIMLLEIVSGQRNRMFNQSPQSENLSNQVWRLWNEKRSFEITDPILLDNCSSSDVKKCIQIGLLCVQENAEKRPKMTTVVLMLTGNVDLPLPLAPAMSFNQYNMPMNYSSSQQSDEDQYSSMSVTMQTDISQDLYIPKTKNPR